MLSCAGGVSTGGTCQILEERSRTPLRNCEEVRVSVHPG